MDVFNYLYQELSQAVGRKVPRCNLWTYLASQDCRAGCNLTSERAANYLETGTDRLLTQCREAAGEERWASLVQKVRDFEPEEPKDSPERTGD